jgi:hypothetical protein
MTIEAIRFSNNQSYYTCIWFDLVLDIKRKSFIEYVLETSDLNSIISLNDEDIFNGRTFD